MNAKEYARLMREELYRQNKSVLEVADDLWLAIADNIEKFAEQSVEEYKGKVIERLKEKVEYAENKAAEHDEKGDIPLMNIWDIEARTYKKAIEIVKSGGVADE